MSLAAAYFANSPTPDGACSACSQTTENECGAQRFNDAIGALDATQTRIRAGRPQTNGYVERLHRTTRPGSVQVRSAPSRCERGRADALTARSQAPHRTPVVSIDDRLTFSHSR